MTTTTRGDRVVQLREARGWTQPELAERLTRLLDKPETVYPETLSRIERRRNETSVGMLAALAQALDTTADYLLGLTDDPSIPALPRYPIPAPELYAALERANALDVGQRVGHRVPDADIKKAARGWRRAAFPRGTTEAKHHETRQ